MDILIYAFIVLAVLAVAALVYAVASARDGYEDETGFHPSPPDPRKDAVTGSQVGEDKASIHPLLHAN